MQRAALDGLSTKRRLRTAVLPIDESGEEQTVNVKRLGRAQRAQLVSKVRTALRPGVRASYCDGEQQYWQLLRSV